ncbi:GAF domain-containing protein [Chitinophaga horti]|uniref:GAF domain-containing protein n=1 Tax=Chitinophaga horti TaxID=2920382 RepID=A0ABY6J4I8_9BACT|nr:GAF domain-containing protein [Chitinophaga horti]UYQ94594.1 GAF domain-containing protein [Chitinophaga horti]
MSQFSKYDSEFCGNLPIHIINTVQTYGVLLIVDKVSGRLVQASENTPAVFNASAREMVEGGVVSTWLGAAANAELQAFAALDAGNEKAAVWQIGSGFHHVMMHTTKDLVLVEIDITGTAEVNSTFTDTYQTLKSAISAIERCDNIDALCEVTARELKAVSGFDKVMVYSFDKDWNGLVLAEAMEPGMETYMGFTFPASDIPKPARDLYLRNPYRFIPDRTFEPVKLFPVINPVTHAFVDLSDCNLRGVAAVHLEYLKNMNVTASMSVRIIKDNELWGLIACHHRTAKEVSGQLCAVFELMSSVISAKVGALEHKAFHDLNRRLGDAYTRQIGNIFQDGNMVQTLLSGQPNLLELFDASGAIITFRNEVHSIGKTPDRAQLEDLLLWLHLKELRKVFNTDSLSRQYDIAKEYSGIGSGLLVIPINAARDEYVLLFRKEYVQTINWGGNPEERIRFEENKQIYHPRHSFKLWQENVEGYSRPWLKEEVLTAENMRSFIFEHIASTYN